MSAWIQEGIALAVVAAVVIANLVARARARRKAPGCDGCGLAGAHDRPALTRRRP